MPEVKAIDILKLNGWYEIGTAEDLGVEAEPGCIILGKNFDRMIYNPKTDKIVGKYKFHP